MKIEIKNTIPFTRKHIMDKELIIKMLKEETKIIYDNSFQSNYKNEYMNPYISIDIDLKAIRLVLNKFGFDTSDDSVSNYRNIFKYYYDNPNNYDEDVINASHYMRSNRLLFYKSKELNIGDSIPNVNLYNLDSTKTNLYEILDKNNQNNFEYTIIASFSMS